MRTKCVTCFSPISQPKGKGRRRKWCVPCGLLRQEKSQARWMERNPNYYRDRHKAIKEGTWRAR